MRFCCRGYWSCETNRKVSGLVVFFRNSFRNPHSHIGVKNLQGVQIVVRPNIMGELHGTSNFIAVLDILAEQFNFSYDFLQLGDHRIGLKFYDRNNKIQSINLAKSFWPVPSFLSVADISNCNSTRDGRHAEASQASCCSSGN